jgi:glycosyltransferase involved in cell wall biosynthesis
VSNALSPFYGYEYLQFQSKLLKKKRAIALIVEKNTRFSACAYIRIILPILERYKFQAVIIKCIDVDELEYFCPDEIITHRVAIGQDKIAFFLEYVKKNKVTYSYDLDDDLLGIGQSNHPEAYFYSSFREVISLLISNASQVTVSTEHLKIKLKNIRSDILVVKNQLSGEIWKPNLLKLKARNGKFNVLYMGTTTHKKDLEMIDKALRKVKQIQGNIQFNIIGVTDDRINNNHLNFIEIPLFARNSYPQFVYWLKSLNTFDLGLAPLADSDFNNSKSNIKCLEYWALGIPVIASNVIPYRGAIEDSNKGLLVENTIDEWVNGILHYYSQSNLTF